MKHLNVRDTLIARTITVMADAGLDKTTTKAIVTGTGFTEVYIYRQFTDKEDLLAKTFDLLDDELVTKALRHVSVMYMPQLDYETRCRFFFTAMWRFFLGNREKCTAYIRYYYSQYFQKYSAEAHRQRYEPLVEKFRDAFRDEANVWMILNHILNVMLDFAVKVFDGAVPDDDDTAEHVFRLVFLSVGQYFRANEECRCE